MKMKKTSIYMAFAAAAILVAVLAVSCVRELEYPRSLYGDKAVLRLTPVCEDLATKIAGDAKYKESNIDGYYWFIYSDAGTTAVRSGYVGDDSVKEIPLDNRFPIATGSTGYVYVVANLPQKPETPAAGDEWFELDSTNHKIKHFVQGAAASDASYGPSVADLKKISFGKNTPLNDAGSIVAGQSEFYRYTSATTGVPDPKRFVMCPESAISFTVTNQTTPTPVEVTAELKRIAAKIVLDLYVAETVRQMETSSLGDAVYKKTWDADPSHIQIYMLWGSTHGNLAGTPLTYGANGVDPSWFYSASPRYAMYSDGGSFNGSSVEGSVSADLYEEVSYPVTTTVLDYVYKVKNEGDRGWIWDNSKLPTDVSDLDSWKTIHWGDSYYGDWAYDPDAAHKQKVTYMEDGVEKEELRTWPRTELKPYYHYKVDKVPPLYTMPISWSVNDAHAPFIKVILPWIGRDDPEGTGAGTPEDPKEFYYKILFPNMTQLDANNCYHIKLDLSVLGSSADESPVETSGQFHVVPWNEPEAMGSDQTAGRFLDVPAVLEFYSQSTMNIPVRSSHDIEVVPNTASYNDYTDEDVTTSYLTLSPTETDGDYYTITTTGKEEVTITHDQEIRLSYLESRDVARIHYKFRVQHKNYPAIYRDVEVIQYPSLYIEANKNQGYLDEDRRDNQGNVDPNGDYLSGYTFVNTRNYIFNRGTYWDNSGFWPVQITDTRWYTTSGLYQSANTNPNMYVVTTKVLANTNLVIGDPRIRATNIITDFIGTPPENDNTGVLSPPENAWQFAPALSGPGIRQLSAGYLQAESSDRTLNMIAPSIRVASSFGATTGQDFETATRRCASYQEDGRPAGRWRLPTAAEIEYLVTLSTNYLIPTLFGDRTQIRTYWSANGYCTVNYNATSPSERVIVRNHDFTGNTYGIRCVYDEWYWGKDVLANRNQFTWGDEYPE